MTTVEVLEKALERLGPNGENWTQGAFFRRNYSLCCPLGAIGLTLSNNTDFPFSARHQARFYLSLAIAGQATDAGEAYEIIRWNDIASRKFPEVKSKFLEAIELAKSEAGQ